MNSLITVCIALVVLIPAALLWLFRRRRKSSTPVYHAKRVVFSAGERSLYAALQAAVGEEFAIFGKVRIGEIIQPRMDSPRHASPAGHTELAERCFSFVLCDPNDLTVVAGVELKEPARRAQRALDENGPLQTLCGAAGLPLIVIGPAPVHDPEELRGIVFDALKPPPLTVPHGDGRKEPRISSIEGLNLE